MKGEAWGFPPLLQTRMSPDSGEKGGIGGWAGSDQNWELLTDCPLSMDCLFVLKTKGCRPREKHTCGACFPRTFSCLPPEQNSGSVNHKEGSLLVHGCGSVPSPHSTLFCVMLGLGHFGLTSPLPEGPCLFWPTASSEGDWKARGGRRQLPCLFASWSH